MSKQCHPLTSHHTAANKIIIIESINTITNISFPYLLCYRVDFSFKQNVKAVPVQTLI